MPEATEEMLPLRPRRFPPYPRYKDCALGEVATIPAHWRLEKLKHVAAVRFSNVDKKTDVGEFAVRLCNYVDVYYRDVIDESIEFMEATASPQEIRKFALRQGDVLITKDSESWDDIAVPAFVASHLKGVLCGYHLAQVRPDNGLRGDYLARCFAAPGIRDQFRVAATGITRFGLSNSSIDNAVFPVPPIEEQGAIASFLDQETAKIDALVAKKERLIELLQEKRSGLMTRAVTKGLDPNVPMKDSGVEWLGEIPAHWGVKRLKYLVPGVTVGIVVTPSKYYVDDGVPCLRSLNISQGEIDMKNLVFISDEANELHRKSKTFQGDVVVVRTGQAGTAAVIPPGLDGANCIDLLIIRRSNQTRSELIYYYLNSGAAISQADVQSVGAIQSHYNTSTLATLLVPMLPLEEQHAIIGHLDEQTLAIDRLAKKIGDGIDRLREFRAALISAAVTGKIDVREKTL